MESFAEQLDLFVRGLGSVTAGLGLYLVALVDSSLLSLPEINDLLLVYVATKFPSKAFYYATMTTLGSATGASLLYWIARRQGHGYLVRKFGGGRIDRVFALFRRYGALCIAVPAILPPPLPFKIFVLSSGVFGLRYRHFLIAILLGRSFRYFGEAYLAVRFGDAAIALLRENFTAVLIGTLVVFAVGFVVVFFGSRLYAQLKPAD